MNTLPLAYFITFHTYGTWLHGSEKGSVDRTHKDYGSPFVKAGIQRENLARQQMKKSAFRLNKEARESVCTTIERHCEIRQWSLHALHVRTNHVHLVITAPVSPEHVLNEIKAWCTRRLREARLINTDQKAWTRHGSTLYLWSEESVHEKIDYTLNQQGNPLD